MTDQIVITEKTSQAKDVRAAVGNRYGTILPAEGHLFDLVEPEEAVPAWKRWSPVLLRPEGLYGTKPASGGNKTSKLKAIKAALNKTQLVAYIVEQSGVEAKAVKAVLASLETSVLGSVDKKGAGEFTLPGLFKVAVQKVPAKAKRFGKDPFTGEERWFPAKPASVKVKVRPLKKLKDAAQ